jgi:hypothetical protein
VRLREWVSRRVPQVSLVLRDLGVTTSATAARPRAPALISISDSRGAGMSFIRSDSDLAGFGH